MAYAAVLVGLGALGVLCLVGVLESVLNSLLVFALRNAEYTLIRAIWWAVTMARPTPGTKRPFPVAYLPPLLAAGLAFADEFALGLDWQGTAPVPSVVAPVRTPTAVVAESELSDERYLSDLWTILATYQEASDKRNSQEYDTREDALAQTRVYKQACLVYQAEPSMLTPPAEPVAANELLAEDAATVVEGTDYLVRHLEGKSEGYLDVARDKSMDADAKLQEAIAIIQDYVSN